MTVLLFILGLALILGTAHFGLGLVVCGVALGLGLLATAASGT